MTYLVTHFLVRCHALQHVSADCRLEAAAPMQLVATAYGPQAPA